MTKKAAFLRWFIPAAVVYAVGFALAAGYDLTINLALYRPGSLFAILMECFGWYPAFLPAILLAMLWMTQRGRPGALAQRVLCGVVVVAGFAAIYFASWGYLEKRGMLEGPGSFLWLAAGLAFAVAMLWFVITLTGPAREKLAFFALCGSLYMVANQVVVYLLKFIWGRVRFDDMVAEGSFDAFRAWYQPFGPGGSSFPSGHTANAAGIFILLVLCELYPALNRRKNLVRVLCWGYVAAMAYARITIGRHFLSDTLAASAMMAILFYLLKNTRLYRSGLRNALKNAALAEQEGPKAPGRR